jgi:Protein of unknown function (DUF2938)
MSIETSYIVGAILVGLGATLVMDLWALFLRRAFSISSLDYCLVGRWFRYMPDGTFRHVSIAAAPPKRSKCTVGWIAHYLIGAVFGLALVGIASGSWLERPTLLPALLFGIGTVLVPFLIMQLSFGLGVAASKTPNPTQARLRSLMAHTAFGIGLYMWALPLSHVLRAHA